MCNFFSCIVDKKGTVYWEADNDNHSLIVANSDQIDDSGDSVNWVRIEIIPLPGVHQLKEYKSKDWRYQIDEQNGVRLESMPTWYERNIAFYQNKCIEALKERQRAQITLWIDEHQDFITFLENTFSNTLDIYAFIRKMLVETDFKAKDELTYEEVYEAMDNDSSLHDNIRDYFYDDIQNDAFDDFCTNIWEYLDQSDLADDMAEYFRDDLMGWFEDEINDIINDEKVDLCERIQNKVSDIDDILTEYI